MLRVCGQCWTSTILASVQTPDPCPCLSLLSREVDGTASACRNLGRSGSWTPVHPGWRIDLSGAAPVAHRQALRWTGSGLRSRVTSPTEKFIVKHKTCSARSECSTLWVAVGSSNERFRWTSANTLGPCDKTTKVMLESPGIAEVERRGPSTNFPLVLPCGQNKWSCENQTLLARLPFGLHLINIDLQVLRCVKDKFHFVHLHPENNTSIVWLWLDCNNAWSARKAPQFQWQTLCWVLWLWFFVNTTSLTILFLAACGEGEEEIFADELCKRRILHFEENEERACGHFCVN